MPYTLRHPDHGFHTCYTPEDVEAHKAIGWVPVEEVKPVEPERKKPGRKPKVKHGD